jgi:hypothetical protein
MPIQLSNPRVDVPRSQLRIVDASRHAAIAKQPTIMKIVVMMPSMIRLRGSSAAPLMEGVRRCRR